MTDPGRAWRSGDDPSELSRLLSREHEVFLATGNPSGRLRPLVVDSWRRCLEGGLDPEAGEAPVELVDDVLDDLRSSHPLAAVMPVIRRLLVEDAVEAGLLVAVSDAAGRLLWVEGQRQARAAAERIHFVEGACWFEDRAGTNAPGTALALDRPVQIFAAEHLVRPVTPWSCTAAPIHDPHTGAVLGALDLTGGHDVAAPHTLSLVRATVAAVESELRWSRGSEPPAGGRPWRQTLPGAPASGTVLEVLGRRGALLHQPASTTELGLRHSELLLLLAQNPQGLSGHQLASALHSHEQAGVTVRAELSRLRSQVAPLDLASRPYRLHEPLRTDADLVRSRLAGGDLGGAVAVYPGPLLPASEAPGIVELRERLHDGLRAALLADGDPDALLRFADTEHGRLDWQVWRTAWSRMEPGSTRREQVGARLARIDAELR